MTKFRNFKMLSMSILAIALMSIFMYSCNNNTGGGSTTRAKAVIDDVTAGCIECHGKSNMGKVIVEDWKMSAHAANGIGCVSCHAAKAEDVDAFEHHGQTIATIVTPKDCATCHKRETDEFLASHHADAGAIMGSLDNVLAEVIEGHAGFNGGENPAAANGCWQCHGSKVTLLMDGDSPKKDENGIPMFDPKTWPNSGIGRINLDGSKGSCSACHQRHKFDNAQARQPENCGKCHMGPDHPQIEIYNESKHGIAFRAYREEMNLSADKWVVGEDYSAAPTCATCHMSATPNQPVTHEVGARISWTLRPKVSEKIDASMKKKYAKLGQELPEGFLSWEARRTNMKDVCAQCHTENYIDAFYVQFDSQVNLYNEKFGKPATKMMKVLKENGLLTPVKFDEKIEWTFFYLWHHEGRRARHGASMMAPDYTQWHGNYEVAERWYMEMVPEIKEIIEHGKKTGNAAGAKVAEAALNEILESEMHRWFLGKMSQEEKDARAEANKKFRERYTN